MSTHLSTKDRRLRTQHVRAIRRLIKETFSISDKEMHEQDQTWKEWVKYCEKFELDDFRIFLKKKVRDPFMARVLANILAPSKAFEPFASPERHQYEEGMLCEIEWVAGSSELQAFKARALQLGISSARIIGTDRDYKRWGHYRGHISNALSVLAENDPVALALFELYDLLPENVLSRPDDYEPFCVLLGSSVPTKWKKLADEKMRSWVLRLKGQHLSGQAIRHYLNAPLPYIRHDAFRVAPQYSKEILASQCEFLVALPISSMPNVEEFGWLWKTLVLGFIEQLAAKKYTELRQRLIRFAIAYDDALLRESSFSRIALAEFPQDTKLSERVNQCAQEEREKDQRKREERREYDAQQKERRALAQSAFEKML